MRSRTDAFTKMEDVQRIEVRDKNGELLETVDEAIVKQFLSLMEIILNPQDPPRIQICDGDRCCFSVRSLADFERFLCKKHGFPLSVVLTDLPPDEEAQRESHLAAALFDV